MDSNNPNIFDMINHFFSNNFIKMDHNDDDGIRPSSKSPRDEVLKNPRKEIGSGDFYGFNRQSGNPHRDEVLRRPPMQENQQQNIVIKEFENEVMDELFPRMFESLFGIPRSFSHQIDHFSNDHRDPFESFFNGFPHDRHGDPFASFFDMDLHDPFAPHQHNHNRRPKEDVDLDSNFRRNDLGDGFLNQRDNSFSRSSSYFKKTTTRMDGNGNKQVKTITRDSSGRETETVETHMPDGSVETTEEIRNNFSDARGLQRYDNNEIGKITHQPCPKIDFSPVKEFLDKPLFKSELFSFKPPPSA